MAWTSHNLFCMILAVSLCLQVCRVSLGDAPADDFFESRIRPLLAEHCYRCHSEQLGKSQGGLKLDTQSALLAGGDSGPAAIAGQPEESLLLKAVRRTDAAVSAMPPDQELTAEQVRDLEKWIADGLVYPGHDQPVVDPRSHWSFQPVSKPAIPEVNGTDWPRSDVDRFLLAKMEEAGLSPAADATPRKVARRVAFALTGLPPTLVEMQAIEEGGAGSLASYVDQLLASPHFGERWARHWMDLVRYSDSGGHEYDYEFEGAWRYRDYLVRAFNSGLPYDQFIREHVAGDLLPPRVVQGRNEAVLGTGWWQLQEQPAAPVDVANDEAERLDNQIDVLGKTFNALTIGCARCHDHKFDPIRTKEYYGIFGIAAASPAHRTWANGPALDEYSTQLKQLRDALFVQRGAWPAVTVPALEIGQSTLLGDFANGLPEGWKVSGDAESVTGQTANQLGLQPGLWSGTLSRRLPAYIRSPQFILEHDQIHVLVGGVDSTLQVVIANYQIIRDPIYPNLKQSIQDGTPRWISIDVSRWKGKRAHIELFTGKVDGSHRILHTHDTLSNVMGLRAVVLSHFGQPDLPLPTPLEIEPIWTKYAEQAVAIEQAIPAPERFIGVQDLNGADLPVYARGNANRPKAEFEPRRFLQLVSTHQPHVVEGSGRRELAETLAAPENPLTARVFVNRVWQHLFGQGLVPTVDNFGILGESPSHPELLDWLADRFMHEHQWNVKPLIREIILTRTYGVEAGSPPESDAANRWLTRFPMRRLEAEAVRDAILAVSGTLDRTLEGEPILVPHDLGGTGSDSGNNYPASGPLDGDRRRSLYLASRRNFPNTFLDVFDKPAPQGTFGRRDLSILPTQALTLLNDPFVQGQAEAWAARIISTDLSPEERVVRMFQEAFARGPSDTEQQRAVSLVYASDAGDNGWVDLALSLFNAKEFIHVP